MPGVFVVLIGIDILLRALDVISSKTHWIIIAVLVILAGLQCIFRSKCKCCNAA
jgi:hypothetical protein